MYTSSKCFFQNKFLNLDICEAPFPNKKIIDMIGSCSSNLTLHIAKKESDLYSQIIGKKESDLYSQIIAEKESDLYSQIIGKKLVIIKLLWASWEEAIVL